METQTEFRVLEPEQADLMTLMFRQESIRRFIKDRLDIEIPENMQGSRQRRVGPIPHDTSKSDRNVYEHMALMTTKSCIQGWGGEEFVDRADGAYKELDEYTRKIINN
jgi:hypothetical protein